MSFQSLADAFAYVQACDDITSNEVLVLLALANHADKSNTAKVTLYLSAVVWTTADAVDRIALGGKWDWWARAVPHPHFGVLPSVLSSDIGYLDVFVAQ
jgi:hypothetical protein